MDLQVGNKYNILNHKIEIKKITESSFGKTITGNCYPHCCTRPNILSIQCKEQDFIELLRREEKIHGVI